MGELVDLMNKTQKTSNIPSVKLEYEPELKEKMERIKREKEREATVDELFEGLNDTYINKLCDIFEKDIEIINLDGNIQQKVRYNLSKP